MKRCSKCCRTFPATADHFSRDSSKKDGFHWCLECKRASNHRWYWGHHETERSHRLSAYWADPERSRRGRQDSYRRHRDRILALRRAEGKLQRQVIKREVIMRYGGRCACCGENRPAFLAIDHIGGGGNQHRRQIRVRAGYRFYFWLKQNNWPSGYQILCHNCNQAISMFNRCPHEEEVESAV